jgi:hypothetical protein
MSGQWHFGKTFEGSDDVLALQSHQSSQGRIFRVLVERAQEGRPWISSTEVSKVAFVSWSTAKSQLLRMTRLGVVCRIGRARATRYRLAVTEESPGRSLREDDV